MTIGYVNGEFISLDKLVIPIDERGHQFGDGVYEVIRVYNGKIYMMKEHIKRLFNSAEAIRMQFNESVESIQQIVCEAVEKSGLSSAKPLQRPQICPAIDTISYLSKSSG